MQEEYEEEVLVIEGLPKISLNAYYAGKHWTNRSKMKEAYALLLSKYKHKFDDKNTYEVEYRFEFKSKPLDATNTVVMVKMVEDVIFKSDTYKVVLSIKVSSKKGIKDKLTIIIKKWKQQTSS